MLFFQTITTPKKERYQLRNRTILTNSNTPDLDTSIPFEEEAQMSPAQDEGILGEVFPEVAQQAQEALLDQIKQLQVIQNLFKSHHLKKSCIYKILIFVLT